MHKLSVFIDNVRPREPFPSDNKFEYHSSSEEKIYIAFKLSHTNNSSKSSTKSEYIKKLGLSQWGRKYLISYLFSYCHVDMTVV